MSHHIIEADNLYYRYPDKTCALNGINFSITHGESVAVSGGNGVGKSTLLMHLNGSLLATSGEMRIGHMPVTKRTLTTIRQSVGMVFQNQDDQLFMSTVFDDIAFGLLNMGLPEQEVTRRVEEALATVGLLKLKSVRPTGFLAVKKEESLSLRYCLCIRMFWLWMNRVLTWIPKHVGC